MNNKILFVPDEVTGRVLYQTSVPLDHTGGVYRDALVQQECYIHLGEVFPVPPPPTPAHSWDWATKQWTLSLDAAKEAKWTAVKEARDSQEFGPFVWSGHTFDGDIQAQRRLNLAVLAASAALQAGTPWSIDWTLSDNSVLPLSASDMVAVVQALGANIDAAHETARAKRALIEAATSTSELDSI